MNGWKIAVDLATHIRLKFKKFQQEDVEILKYVMGHSEKFYKGKDFRQFNAISFNKSFEWKIFLETIEQC